MKRTSLKRQKMIMTIYKFVHHCALRLAQRQVLAPCSDGSIHDRKFENLVWSLVAYLLKKTEIKHRLSMKKRDWSWTFLFLCVLHHPPRRNEPIMENEESKKNQKTSSFNEGHSITSSLLAIFCATQPK